MSDKVLSVRERILAKRGIVPSQTVHIDEWGEDLEVRSLNAGEKLDFTEKYGASPDNPDIKGMYLDLVVSCTHAPNEDDKLFTADDVDSILELSGSAIEQLAQAALEVSGMTEETLQKEGEG